MQLICVDEQHFAKIRAQGGVYVDKTERLYNIFQKGTYFFISRPRRFGKSLLCSTIAELFSNNRPLFKNTWIDQSDWEWQEHPVIRLDMTKAAGAASDAAAVRRGMVYLLNDNARLLLGGDLKEDSPHLMFRQLIQQVYEKTGKGVVVVVDEYDKPLLDTIDDPNRYKDIHKELASFYGQLKASSEQLRLVFFTGVFKFAQTSIFSGLNNIIDLTFNPKAAEMLGYTDEEIKHFFAQHLEALADGYKLSEPAILKRLRDEYNGYTFGVDDKADCVVGSVYNPFALNNVFYHQQMLEKWFNTGTPTALVKLLEQDHFDGLMPENLAVPFTLLDKSCSYDEMNSLFMLYYAGYLTLKSYRDRKVTLDFPNMEVRSAFSLLLLPLILQKKQTAISMLAWKLKDLLIEERLEDLKNMLNDALAPVAYPVLSQQERDYTPKENVYQIAFYYLFAASGMVTNLEEMTNRGRIDITIQLAKVVYIVELKMDQPAAVGIQQIKDTDYAAKFRHDGKKIYAIGVALSSKERMVDELLYEIL